MLEDKFALQYEPMPEEVEKTLNEIYVKGGEQDEDKKEVAIKNCQNQISSMQESLLVNTAFSLEERIMLVSYLDSVRGELKEKISN